MATVRPTILLVDVDPYVEHVVRERYHETCLVVSPTGDLTTALAGCRGRVVALVATTSARLGQVLVLRHRIGVVGCASPHDTAWTTSDLDAVLVRPFSADEVERVLDGLLWEEDADEGPGLATPDWMRWWERHARTVSWVALALAAPLEVGSGELFRYGLLLLVVGSLLLPLRGRAPTVSLARVAFVATVLALTGGPASSYTPLALAVAVDAGMGGSLRTSARRALVLSASAIGGVPLELQAPQLVSLVSYVVLFPAVAASIAQSVRLAQMRSSRDDPELAPARAVRDALQVASLRARRDQLPLTVEGAARVLLSDATALGARAAVVLAAGPGTFTELASTGLLPHPRLERPRGEDDAGPLRRLRTADPAPVDRNDLRWFELDVRDAGATQALLVLGFEPRRDPPAAELLDRLARRGAITLESARAATMLRSLSTDRERLAIAHILRDELAQSLVHVRMELDLLRHGADGTLDDRVTPLLHRLHHALTDVQGLVADLGASGVHEGLGPALRQLARDLSAWGGPLVVVRSRTRLRLGPTAEQGVFDVARRAVLAAQSHESVTEIVVSLDEIGGTLRVAVEDDGMPTAAASHAEVLRELESRAAAVGARATAVVTPERGWRVELHCDDADAYSVLP